MSQLARSSTPAQEHFPVFVIHWQTTAEGVINNHIFSWSKLRIMPIYCGPGDDDSEMYLGLYGSKESLQSFCEDIDYEFDELEQLEPIEDEDMISRFFRYIANTNPIFNPDIQEESK